MIVVTNQYGTVFECYDHHAAKAMMDVVNQNKLWSGGVMLRLRFHENRSKVWQTAFTRRPPHLTYGDSVEVRVVALCRHRQPNPVTFKGYDLRLGAVTDCAKLVEQAG